MRAAVLAPFFLLACSKPAASSPPAVHHSAAPPTAGSAKAVARVHAGGASAVSEETGLYDFDYSYPAEAGRIPALRARLDGERDRARRELIANAREGRAAAGQAGFEYQPYASATKWLKVAETPRFLSLSAELYDFSGGAHPNHGFAALLWDKAAGARREASDLFVSKQALRQAVQKPFCAALDRQRAKKRAGEPVGEPDDEFNKCIDPVAESVVILGSANGRTFDRIGFLIGPYAAGPYAEGDYEVTLAVTPAVLAAVKPEFRGEFSVRR